MIITYSKQVQKFAVTFIDAIYELQDRQEAETHDITKSDFGFNEPIL